MVFYKNCILRTVFLYSDNNNSNKNKKKNQKSRTVYYALYKYAINMSTTKRYIENHKAERKGRQL